MDRQAIHTVAEAVAFLRSIEVETIGIWHGWILHGIGPDNGDFELTCDSNADLIDYARSERDICRRIRQDLGLDSLSEPKGGLSSSSTAEACGSPVAGDQAKEVKQCHRLIR